MDLGVREILKTGKELMAPTNQYMRDESNKMIRGGKYFLPYALSKAIAPTAWVIPGVTAKEINKKLDRDFADKVGGFGKPLANVSAEALVSATIGKGLRMKKPTVTTKARKMAGMKLSAGLNKGAASAGSAMDKAHSNFLLRAEKGISMSDLVEKEIAKGTPVGTVQKWYRQAMQLREEAAKIAAYQSKLSSGAKATGSAAEGVTKYKKLPSDSLRFAWKAANKRYAEVAAKAMGLKPEELEVMHKATKGYDIGNVPARKGAEAVSKFMADSRWQVEANRWLDTILGMKN